MKSLFIPLNTEYYRQFESGAKRFEYRVYGPRWNERTCAVGRSVTLARGYSTQDRIHGTVASFRRITRTDLPTPEAYNAWLDCYGPDQDDIAEIGISLEKIGGTADAAGDCAT